MTDRAAVLADEIRKVVEALSTTDIPDDQLDEAIGLARQMATRLDGPPNVRWYETGPLDSDELGLSGTAYQQQSPLRGARNPIAPPLVVEETTDPDGEQLLVGRARLGPAYEGPPHGVHGGWVAALFDDILGATLRFLDDVGVTGRLTVEFRHITPIDEDLELRAWIQRSQGRRTVAKATCHAGDTLTAEAEALFIQVDFEEVQTYMAERRQGRRPGDVSP